MSTYDLNQYQLNTLLASTVVPSTSATIIAALEHVSGGAGVYYSEYPEGKQLIPVQTESTYQNGPITVSADEALFIDTVATSVIPPASPKMVIPQTAPGPDTSGPYTVQTLITSGGLMIAAGDQNIKIWDQGPGDDTLVGGAGREALHVTSGNNLLIAGAGHNTLYGGSGSDTLIGGGESRLVAAQGVGGGSQLLEGDTLPPASASDVYHDTLRAGSGDDTLKVFFGDNRLVAGTGNSTLYGGSGDDTLVGGASSNAHVDIFTGAGSENILAGGGDDSISTGLTGNDTITSGAGTAAVHSAQSADDVVFHTPLSGTATGYTEIAFKDGQILTVKGLTVDFTGGGSLPT
jgi:Ca2+-binding RTX toxin-like protein